MEEGHSISRGRIISCLKACKMISKGSLYRVVIFTYLGSKNPHIVLVPVVWKFPEVFTYDLPRIPPEREINFGIDLLLETNPISIPPYRITQDEFKELRSQFKDLLDYQEPYS